MKKLRTISSALLALFVLMSSVSLSVSFHICEGELQSVAIFGKAQPCQEHDKKSNSCDHGRTKHSPDHKGCCEDTSVSTHADAYKITEKVTIETSQFVFLPAAGPIEVINSYAGPAVQSTDYRPPSIERDITILVQKFLI